MKTTFILSVTVLSLLLATTTRAQQVTTDTIRLTLFTDSVALSEVVVKGSRKPKTNSRWNDLQPVDLLTAAGTNGNVYGALQTLPGVQLQGESGRLLVRGGSSRETQTYIDGMHVLNPYTSTGNEMPARGRYSPFMFEGINLSTGGQPLEYGDALSGVLPMDTKNHSRTNKLGANLSTVGVGGGGTQTFKDGSVSANIDYLNMGPYYHVYPSRVEFEKPYRTWNGSAQVRYSPDEYGVFKVFAGYDRTDFSNYTGTSCRLFALQEDNYYLNTTYRRQAPSGWNSFVGLALSAFNRKVDGAAQDADRWQEQQQELHLKGKLSKSLSPVWRMEAGAETMLRRYADNYVWGSTDADNRLHPSVSALFASGTIYLLENLKAELSLRGEYTAPSKQTILSPRITVDYRWQDVVFSATAGRYTQLPEVEYLLQNTSLLSETCRQYNFGIRYDQPGRYLKAELYYKDYSRLALVGADGASVTSDGYGTARGVDFFFSDRNLFPHFEYQLAYSYNDSQRKYGSYPELTTPQYATRHNASVVLKYTIPSWNTIFGVTNQFASGRPYHNPERSGLMNDEAKPFNSLNVSITHLFSRKVMVYASADNILCRRNEFGRVNGASVLPSSDHFFYVGLYITLGKNAAYDFSNF